MLSAEKPQKPTSSKEEREREEEEERKRKGELTANGYEDRCDAVCELIYYFSLW